MHDTRVETRFRTAGDELRLTQGRHRSSESHRPNLGPSPVLRYAAVVGFHRGETAGRAGDRDTALSGLANDLHRHSTVHRGSSKDRRHRISVGVSEVLDVTVDGINRWAFLPMAESG